MIRRYSSARFVSMAMVVALGCVLLLARMAWVQIVRGGEWQRRARKQSSQVHRVEARRGRILDRNGIALAMTESRVRVGVQHPARWRSPERSRWLAQMLDVPPSTLRRRLAGHRGHLLVGAAVLAPEIRDSLACVPDITLEEEAVRVYPLADVARRLLGTVAQNRRGSSGIERAYDAVLAGRPGRELIRYDGGLRQDTLVRTPIEAPVDGADLRLCLDAWVQMILEEELERTRKECNAHRAQGIVIDPRSGEVLALAQTPFKPARNAELGDVDPYRVMAATDLFEPGSTFKLFTMASLLSRGVCDTTQIFDGLKRSPDQHRSIKDMGGGFLLRDVHPVGRISLRHAFVVSSNIIMATAAGYLQDRELYEDLRRFGFARGTGSGLPAETAGQLRPIDEWSKRSRPTIAIGQEVGVSFLQMAMGYAALIGDGTLRSPRLVRSWCNSDGSEGQPGSNVQRRGVVPPSIIALLRALCTDVVEQSYGTGHKARVSGLRVAGKTGTAQISTSQGYLKGFYTPSFVGFLPADDPRLLVAIVLHRAEGEMVYGGNSAAPCFARIVRKIAPSTDLLDAGAVEAPMARITLRSAPKLVGRRGNQVAQIAARGGFVLVGAPPSADARAIGQIPEAGTPIVTGTPIRVAWMKGQP